MNIGIVIGISVLDALAIIPFNSELSLLNFLNAKKYNFRRYIVVSTLIYVIPSIIGTLIAYLIGYFFGDKMSVYIDYITRYIFAYSIKIKNINLLTTLMFKIFVPIIPISLINILCGIYRVDFLQFVVISFLLRYTRILLLYNAIIYKQIYNYIRIILYSGIWTILVRVSTVLFYKIV